MLGLTDELRAMAAAETKQRRRAEQLLAAEPGLQLLERAQRVGRLGAGDDDAHEVAERRIAERAPPGELAREESRHVVARRVRDRARVGLERLHEDASGRT